MVRILACLDFSPLSDRVLAEASALARATGAALVLLAAERREPALSSGGALPQARHVPPEDAVPHRKKLESLAEELRRAGLDARAEFRLTDDPIDDAVIAAGEELGATHLVVGSHGHAKVYELLVGSVTSGVLRKSRVPVVVVPAHTGEPE